MFKKKKTTVTNYVLNTVYTANIKKIAPLGDVHAPKILEKIVYILVVIVLIAVKVPAVCKGVKMFEYLGR